MNVLLCLLLCKFSDLESGTGADKKKKTSMKSMINLNKKISLVLFVTKPLKLCLTDKFGSCVFIIDSLCIDCTCVSLNR